MVMDGVNKKHAGIIMMKQIVLAQALTAVGAKTNGEAGVMR